jgi:hypothetical protein
LHSRMTCKRELTYQDLFRMFNNHLLAFNVYTALNVTGNSSSDRQLYLGWLMAGKAVDGPLGHLFDPQGSTRIAKKSNTNMHNYEHTFLHNLLPE